MTSVIVKSRGELYLSAAGLCWLMWLFGSLSQSAVRTLSVFLFDLLGAYILIALANRLPVALRLTVVGLGLSLASISIGDGNLAVALLSGTAPEAWLVWRQPFFYLGSLLVTIFALQMPFALYRQGLYPKIKPLQVILIAVLLATVFTGMLLLFKTPTIASSIFFFVACLVTALFWMQNFVLTSSELSTTLKQLSVVFVLASLGRLLFIMINNTAIGDVLYDLCWCAGISAASWTMIIRQ